MSFTVEHLLLALLDNDSAVNALKACGADIVSLRKELEEYVEQHTLSLAKIASKLLIQQKVLTAFCNVLFFTCNQVVAIVLLKVLMFWSQCIQSVILFAVYLLKRHQINRLTLTQYLSHGTRKDEVQVEEEVEDIEGETSASNAGHLSFIR